MNFIKFPKCGISIRMKDIVAVKLHPVKGPECTLELYTRGIPEPFKVAWGNQGSVTHEYDRIIELLQEEHH